MGADFGAAPMLHIARAAHWSPAPRSVAWCNKRCRELHDIMKEYQNEDMHFGGRRRGGGAYL